MVIVMLTVLALVGTANDMKYNKKADKYLAAFYRSVGAKTWEQKFNVLELRLGIVKGSQSFSHDLTWRQKTGILEYELLEHEGLIKITYV